MLDLSLTEDIIVSLYVIMHAVPIAGNVGQLRIFGPIFIVQFLGVKLETAVTPTLLHAAGLLIGRMFAVTSDGDVHAQTYAHVGVLVESVVGLAVQASIHIAVPTLGIVGLDALIVLVFDVAIGTLNGDVHALANAGVGKVVASRVVGAVVDFAA